jgi:hypothetical protein
MMSKATGGVLLVLAFAAGVASQAWLASSIHAQGRVSPLKQVDLGEWCPGKELAIGIEEIGPQHQSKHYHNAYSFAWMVEGAQRRMVDGKPVESFKVGDVVTEAPGEISESDILEPTKVLLFRIAEKGKPLTVRIR